MNHCNTMRETIQQQQAMIDTYHQQPWLEDMISRANEVLNALLRLQKQQMAAQEEQRQVHFYNTPYAPPGFYVSLQPTHPLLKTNNGLTISICLSRIVCQPKTAQCTTMTMTTCPVGVVSDENVE